MVKFLGFFYDDSMQNYSPAKKKPITIILSHSLEITEILMPRSQIHKVPISMGRNKS